uniref:BTB domain-containing protein n=1 Tax=Steinernema glaseri TaxID=37863 RepID=A0A1I8AR80_9BILA
MGSLEEDSSSAEVLIGGAKWSLFCGDSYFEFRSALGVEAHVLWSCTARGKLTVWGPGIGRRFLVWTDSFDYLNTLDGYAYSDCLRLPKTGATVSFDAEIEVVKVRVVDFSPPPNATIHFHSPAFEALFSSDSKEQVIRSYVLEEVKMDDLKLFLSVLYNLEFSVRKGESLEGLLRLAQMYQSDLVLRFCLDILSSSDSVFIPLETQIKLCDRHGFWPLLKVRIRDVPRRDPHFH